MSAKKTLIQVCREFWFPLCAACCWVLYEWINSAAQDKTLAGAIKAFGAAFFFVSWLLSQWFRIRKQQKLEGGLSTIEESVNKTLRELESRTKDISCYITGGDSVCYFQLIDPIGEDGSISRLALLHHGAHPLYEVSARISDCDADLKNFGPDATFKQLYDAQKYVSLDNLPPSMVTVHPIKLELGTTDERNFMINFYARNGAFVQLLKFKKNGTKFALATKVIRKKTTVLEKITKNFPLDGKRSIEWHENVEKWPS